MKGAQGDDEEMNRAYWTKVQYYSTIFNIGKHQCQGYVTEVNTVGKKKDNNLSEILRKTLVVTTFGS